MSKNNLRRITLVGGPIWGIHSLTLIISWLWVIVPVNPRKNRASSELLYKSNRPQVSMGYTNNSRHLARKYARIFVRGHYLFREANSFPRAKLEENCELRGTDNVQGQISEHIFAPNGGYCLYYPSNLFRNARNFQNWGIFNNYSPKWRWLVVVNIQR